MTRITTKQPAAMPSQAMTPVMPAASMLAIIARAVSDPAVDVAKMQALLDMQERILAKQAEAEFNAALVRLADAMPRVRKNGRVELGGGKGYDFARWEDMDTVVRPHKRREGFTLSFDMEAREGGGAVVIGTLLHAGGHSRRASIPLGLDAGAGRNSLQAMGSTLSYGKRYCAEMLLNIVREGADNDGLPATNAQAAHLSAAQVEELHALMRETRTLEARFLSVMAPGLRSVADAPAADFPRLKNALLTKRAALAKRTQHTGEAA